MRDDPKPTMKAVIKAVRQVMADEGLNREWLTSTIREAVRLQGRNVANGDPTLVERLVKKETALIWHPWQGRSGFGS